MNTLINKPYWYYERHPFPEGGLHRFRSLVHYRLWDLRSRHDRTRCRRFVVAAVAVVEPCVAVAGWASHPSLVADGDENERVGVNAEAGDAAVTSCAVAIETVWKDDRCQEAVEHNAGGIIHVTKCPPLYQIQ